MRWPATCRLIDRIKAERPDLNVDYHATGNDHYVIRICCIRKTVFHRSCIHRRFCPIVPRRPDLPPLFVSLAGRLCV
jgi:hypothetical protein